MMPNTTPIREIRLAPTDVQIDHRPDGTIYVRSQQKLADYPARMTDRLDHWAQQIPDRTFIAQRTKEGPWRRLTYAEAAARGRRIGHALTQRPLSAKRPVAILSGNDLEHALLGFGAMYAGIPYSPISTAYSLVSQDFGKLKHIFHLLNPGLVFAANGRQFARALQAVLPPDAELVCTADPLPGATLFSDLEAATAGPALEQAHSRVGPDTVFKILFTSGSTGRPKGVIYTHRVWVSNQQMVRQCWEFLEDEPPVILEWLPWNHTFAGSKDFGLIVYNGGTLYLDDGKPVPGAFEETLRNLREIAPTIVLNVPKGYEAVIPYLREDAEFRRHYFSRLKALFYAGAGVSQEVWDTLQDLSYQACGERILMLSGLGATETGPFALWVGKDVRRAGECGVPAPGMELKLVPTGRKLEARFRGPNITPGYWNEPELTRAAFDEEGFYKIGDALRFVDESDPAKGFLFDGRIGEDFKLSTATWVSVGPLRVHFLAHFSPYAKEVVIAGVDRDDIGVLVFPDLEACRELAPGSTGATELIAHPRVRAKFKELLASLAKNATGSSNRIVRAIVLDVPPSIDAHELTDKGSISQRAVLENRADVVDELYRGSPRVISIEDNQDKQQMSKLSEIAESFHRDLSRLQQEVDSFPDDAALWRVAPGVKNSAGNLVLHLEGNMRDYIGRALGGIPFQRVRQAEFTRTGVTRHELHAILDELREMVPAVIGHLRADTLDEIQSLQLSGKQVSTFQYLLLLYGHLSYHLGQVDYLRRISGAGSAIAFVELR